MNTEYTKTMKINEWVDVKPIHCHQRLKENALVEKLRFISEDKKLTEVLHRFVPKELSFFFDHDIDHLPGMLEASAMRQACLAVAHIIYDVPMDYIAIMDFMLIKIYNYGELNMPVCTKGEVKDIIYKKNKIIIDINGVMMQEGYPLMKTEGRLITLAPLLAAKIRHKKMRLVTSEGEEKPWTNL